MKMDTISELDSPEAPLKEAPLSTQHWTRRAFRGRRSVRLKSDGDTAPRRIMRTCSVRVAKSANSLTAQHDRVTFLDDLDIQAYQHAGPNVQLTLLAKADTVTSPEKGDISGPKAVDSEKVKELQNDKIKTIRTYYDKVKQDYERSLAEYNNSRTAEARNACDDNERLLKKLEQQYQALTGSQPDSAAASSAQGSPKSPGTSSLLAIHTPPPGGTSPSPTGTRSGSFGGGDALDNIQEENSTPESTPSKSWTPAHRKTESLPESGVDQLDTTGDSGASRPAMDKSPAAESIGSDKVAYRAVSLPTSVHDVDHSPSRSPVQAAGNTSSSHEEIAHMLETPPQKPINVGLHVNMPQQVQVISMEDDEFNSTDDEHLEEHGPFSDLNQLKGRPGHLAVFVYYLMSNSDPAPLFFYLVTEQYTQGSKSELRKWAYEIYSTFLHEKAPLRVEFSEDIVTNIAQKLERSDKEEVMRSVFQVTRHLSQGIIGEMLEDFRNKRAMGLAGLYGEAELHDEHMDRAQEIKVVEKILWKEFERLLEIQEQSDRNQALVIGLATFFRFVGMSTQKSSSLDRVPSFMAKDKRLFKMGKSSKKGYAVKGHTFVPNQYLVSTLCGLCHGLLWGVGQQGVQCMNCEYNAHRQCMDRVMDTCSKKRPGDEKSKNRRSNVYSKFLRRQTGNNTSAIEASKRHHEEQESKLGPSHRTISLPSGINHKDARKTSFYAPSPPSTPVAKQMPHDIPQSDQVRDAKSGWVRDQVEHFETGAPPTSCKSPPRSNSPEPMDSDQNDVQVDDQTLKTLNQSESSSTSSLSNRSLESPSQSQDGLAENTHHLSASLHVHYDDSDFDVEPELPPLDQVIPKDMLKKLKPKDKKRQEVLNELFYTERNHLRNLIIMHKVFYVPMIGEHWISKDLVKLLFPNLEDMITLHSELNHSFLKKKEENPVVGDVAHLLISRFSGEAGDKYRMACATCCCDQTHALDMLRYKLRKDQKFNTFVSELNMNPLCRKLDLKSFLPVQMQRLTKYPLLIENLMKYTSSHTAEHGNLQEASVQAKATLAYVNAAVQECENKRRLEDLQRRMDKRPIENSAHPLLANYKNLDLRDHRLVYEGNLVWRINKQKSLDLYVVLFEDVVVLFQKQDDKLVLRCQSTMLVHGKDDTKFTHSPIIVTADCMVKPVATDKKGIFLVSMLAPPQVYELVANSTEEKKIWFKHLSMYAKYNAEGSKRPTVRNRPASSLMTSSQSAHTKLSSISSPQVGEGLEGKKSASVENIKALGEKVHVEEQPELIQPSEVQVSKVLDEKQTVLQLMREQDEIVRKAMQEKARVVAEHLNVPYEDFDTIAELSSEEQGKKDFSHILLAAINESKRLTQLVHQSLSTIPSKPLYRANSDSKEEVSSATSGDKGSAAGGEVMLAVSRKELSSISNKLSDQMSQLLTSIREKEEEHQRVHQKLKALQEQVNLYKAMLPIDSAYSTMSRPASSDTEVVADDQTTPTPTPSLQLEQAAKAPIIARPRGELYISESETTGSRPVSMISVTSEKSMTSETSDDMTGDVEDNDDEMTQTLTSPVQLKVTSQVKDDDSHEPTSAACPQPGDQPENQATSQSPAAPEIEVVECTSHALETVVDKPEVLNDSEQDDKEDSSVISENEKLEIVEEKDEELVETEDTGKTEASLTQDSRESDASAPVELIITDIDSNETLSGQNSDIKLVSEDTAGVSASPSGSSVPLDTLQVEEDNLQNESETDNFSDSKDMVDNVSQDNLVKDESETQAKESDDVNGGLDNGTEVQQAYSPKQLDNNNSDDTEPCEITSEVSTEAEGDRQTAIPVQVTECTETVCTETVEDYTVPLTVQMTDTQNMDCQTEDDPEILAMCDSYSELYDNTDDFVDAQAHQVYVDVDGVEVYVHACEGHDEGHVQGHTDQDQTESQGELVDCATDPMCFEDVSDDKNDNVDGEVTGDDTHEATATSNCDNCLE